MRGGGNNAYKIVEAYKKKLEDVKIEVLKIDDITDQKIDDKIIDLSTKVVVELFKTLWQRKSFWESALKNVSR